MSPEEKEQLEETLELVRENNKMLRALKRQMFWGRVTAVIYWLIILGVAASIYYYLQPYIDGLINTYGSLKANIEGFGDLVR